MQKGWIRVSRQGSLKVRHDLQLPSSQAVAYVHAEVRDGSVIRSIVQHDISAGISADDLMRGRARIFPVEEGQRNSQSQTVGQGIVRVQNDRMPVHVADILGPSIGESM